MINLETDALEARRWMHVKLASRLLYLGDLFGKADIKPELLFFSSRHDTVTKSMDY